MTGFGGSRDSAPLTRCPVPGPPGASDKRTFLFRPLSSQSPLVGVWSLCQASVGSGHDGSSRAILVPLSSETQSRIGVKALSWEDRFQKPSASLSGSKLKTVSGEMILWPLELARLKLALGWTAVRTGQ